MGPHPRVWVTRALPGAERTAERLSALGHTPVVVPLLVIEPLEVRLDLTGVQALAFSSRNGVETFAARSHERGLPVFAVGDATAETARQAGFTTVRSAGGDLAALAALIRAEAAGLSILHPCAAQPAGDLAAAVAGAAAVSSVPVYAARETGAAPPEAWDIVLIHSPRAARALAAALAPDQARDRIAVALSAAAAAPLTSLPFAEVRTAQATTEAALLATLGKPGTGV